MLDVASHWCQMYAATSRGGRHHKSAAGNAGRSRLVQAYYASYPFFGYCCVGTELTYVALYVRARLAEGSHPRGALAAGIGYFLMVSVPACTAKQVVNLSQLGSSCYAVAEGDAARKNA